MSDWKSKTWESRKGNAKHLDDINFSYVKGNRFKSGKSKKAKIYNTEERKAYVVLQRLQKGGVGGRGPKEYVYDVSPIRFYKPGEEPKGKPVQGKNGAMVNNIIKINDMQNRRLGTIIKDISNAVKDKTGDSGWQQRLGSNQYDDDDRYEGNRYWVDPRHKGGYYDVMEKQREKNAKAIKDEPERRKTNQYNIEFNKKLEAKDALYEKVKAKAKRTLGEDYLQKWNELDADINNLKKQGFNDKQINNIKKGLRNQYDTFYKKTKIKKWNPNLGAKPAWGDFDDAYYEKNNKNAKDAWREAKRTGNLDVLERYSNQKDIFLLGHYTHQGKAAGARGNKAEGMSAVKSYREAIGGGLVEGGKGWQKRAKERSDQDRNILREKQLGIDDQANQTQRLLGFRFNEKTKKWEDTGGGIPELRDAWSQAKKHKAAGKGYWNKHSKKNLLDPNSPDQFIALFRLSERDQDKAVNFKYQIGKGGTGITEIEDLINTAMGEGGLINTKRFAALTQDVLNESIEAMKAAKAKEGFLDTVKGFGSFGEIYNMNQDITNSILGDSGVGGVMGFMGGNKAKDSLEKSIMGVTGLGGNTITHNWENWFENTLQEKYNKNIELGYTDGEAKEQITIQKDFAKQFINDYLKPRFDESKSMSEFKDYINVEEDLQNPFQTQSTFDALKNASDSWSKSFQDSLKDVNASKFNAKFYFDPVNEQTYWTQDKKGKWERKKDSDRKVEDRYIKQKDKVQGDFAAAKKNPNAYIDPKNKKLGTWAQRAYQYGIDLNNQDEFASMHYQVVGKQTKHEFDGASDILNAQKVKDNLYKNLLPNLEDEMLKTGTVFGDFIKPEEFADDMLKGLDPSNNDEWKEALAELGISEDVDTIEELKGRITETIRGGDAITIRQHIKFLNERNERPTQKLLGIDYIQRDEDYKPADKLTGDTPLFKAFQSAGYQGDEESFYTDLFPDLDRSDQDFLALGTKSGLKSGAKAAFDFSDPYKALGNIDNLLGSDAPFSKKTKKKSATSWLYEDDDEEEDEPFSVKNTFGNSLSGFSSFF
jgi:hypothetical protein